MTDIHVLFKSSNYRLKKIERLRSRGAQPFFKQLSFDYGSPFLHFTNVNNGIERNISACQLYYQPLTITYIYTLTDPVSAHTIVVKIYKIRDGPRANTEAPHDIEIRYLRVLADFVVRDVTPHVTLPIGRTIVDAPMLKKLFPTIYIPKDAINVKFHVILSEYAEKTLTAAVRSKTLTPYEMKCVLFQVVYSLAAIQKDIPYFRHHDLHISNVLLQSIDADAIQQTFPNRTICSSYAVNGCTYYHKLVHCQWRALLWDMYFSSAGTGNHIAYMASSSKKANDGAYADLHKLFDSLFYMLQHLPASYRSSLIELEDFIHWMVPDNLKCMSKKLTYKQKAALKLGTVRPEVTPMNVLETHAYFKELQIMPHKIKIIKTYSCV